MLSVPDLAVTGVTGAVGGAVARLLTSMGHPIRVLVRDPAKLPELPQVDEDSEVALAAYGAPDAADALQGISTVFMVSAAESAQRLDDHRNFVDAACTAGVRHVVYTSFVGASPDSVFTLGRDHFYTEEYIRASGLEWTFLRDSFYADVFEGFAGPSRTLRGPAADGRVAPVARADVARVAAAVLDDPGRHIGRTYNLTGPEAMTLGEMADLFTAVRGAPFRYVPETLDAAYASRSSYDAPQWQIEAWVSTYTAIADGELDIVTDDVLSVTGSKAMSFEELVRSTPPVAS